MTSGFASMRGDWKSGTSSVRTKGCSGGAAPLLWAFEGIDLKRYPLGFSCAIQCRYIEVRKIPAAAGRTLSASLEVLNDLGSGVAAILRHRDGASVDGCHAGVTILFPSHSSGGEQATVFPLLVAEAVSQSVNSGAGAPKLTCHL